MALKPQRYQLRLNAQELRIRRLERLCHAATWWLILLGLLNLFMGPSLSLHLDLRYTIEALPVLRSLGLAYLLLAIYLRRTLNEPENQYLSVDLLLLFFWAQLVLTLQNKMGGASVFVGEWAVFAGNLCFAFGLVILRTSNSNMTAGAPGTKDAGLATRETITRLKTLLGRRQRQLHPPSSPENPTAPKPISEVEPHLD